MRSTTNRDFLFPAAVLLPVVLYLAYSWHFSGTLFYADDFHLLKSVQWGKEATSFGEKIRLLYQQHQEHRIVIPRLLTLSDYFIEGHINWKTLILVANIFWCGTIFLLWKTFQSLKINKWYFAAVPWLLLHPQYYENINWSISILQQSDVVFLFTLLAYLCARRKFNAAILIAVIATFTHGNGIFTFPIAILFAALEKNWKAVARIAVVMILVSAFYFLDFKAGQNASISKSLSDPFNLLQSFGVFFGGITLVLARNYGIAAFFGLAAIGILVFRAVITLKESFQNPSSLFDRVFWGITAFLVITGSLVVATRSWTGVESIAAPRYLHYSSYVAALLYLSLLRISTPEWRKRIAFTLTPAAVLICMLSYLNYTPKVRFLRDQLLADEINYLDHGVFLQYFPSFNSNISEPYRNAAKSGVVVMNDKISRKITSAENYPGPPLEVLEDSVSLEDANRTVSVKNARITGVSPTKNQFFIVLRKNEEKPYWIPAFVDRAAYRSMLTSMTLTGDKFEGNVILNNLSPGKYQLGLFADNKVLWTDQQIEASGE